MKENHYIFLHVSEQHFQSLITLLRTHYSKRRHQCVGAMATQAACFGRQKSWQLKKNIVFP